MQENEFVKRERKPRYIDATKLEELCDIMADKCDGNGESVWNQFRTAVECSPTVDAIEVVRCKDCKWFDRTHPYGTLIPVAFHCKVNDRFFTDGFYCGYGERRTDEL